MADVPNGCDTSGSGGRECAHIAYHLARRAGRPCLAWPESFLGPNAEPGYPGHRAIRYFSTFFFLLRAFEGPGTCHCRLPCPANCAPLPLDPTRHCVPPNLEHLSGQAHLLKPPTWQSLFQKKTSVDARRVPPFASSSRGMAAAMAHLGQAHYTASCPHASLTVGSCVRRTSPATLALSPIDAFTSRMRSAVPQTKSGIALSVSPSRLLAAQPAPPACPPTCVSRILHRSPSQPLSRREAVTACLVGLATPARLAVAWLHPSSHTL
jgi:hypothetical protein